MPTNPKSNPNLRSQQDSGPVRRRILSSRRSRLAILGVAFGVVFLVFVGPISFSGNNKTIPVVPAVKKEFSLDLEVLGTTNHDLVYVVEQRASPKYRVFAFNPATGVAKTIFAVPKGALVYGISLSPDRKTLAVSYSPDFHTNGSGISLLNLEKGTLAELTPVAPEIFNIDLEWSSDGSTIYSTHVDQTSGTQQIDIAQTSVADKAKRIVIRNGMNPRFQLDKLYYLDVDKQIARHAIRIEGKTLAIAVGDGNNDLDHLLKGSNDSTLRVAVIAPSPQPSVTVGTPASAHGNHDVPSAWWDVSASNNDAAPIGLDPIIVYDAATRGPSIVYATVEGLSIATGTTKVDLIASRAIRFVAT